MWGTSIDGLLTFGFGILACYYGFRGPPVSNDEKLTANWQQWHKRWGKWVKIGGVVLVLYGLFLVLTSFLHA
jgi:hypothetical protein